MCFKDEPYSVVFTEFSNRYYKKTLGKRYKTSWKVTEKAIINTLERLFGISKTDKFKTIKKSQSSDFFICKMLP